LSPHPPGRDAHHSTSTFGELMTEVMSDADRFGHRQHIHLTWLAVRRYGTPAAAELISGGIKQTATYAGAPQKYNATVTGAWVELVGHHTLHSDADMFDDFARQNAELLDKKLLTRFYRSSTLASDSARTAWVEPDLASFPWIASAS
jgi:predicted nucleic acid-binding protein